MDKHLPLRFMLSTRHIYALDRILWERVQRTDKISLSERVTNYYDKGLKDSLERALSRG